MLDKLDVLQQTALRALEALPDLTALDAWHVQYLGRKGELTQLLRSVGQLAKKERPAAGRRANEVKTALEAAHKGRLAELKRQARDAARPAAVAGTPAPQHAGLAPHLCHLC